MHRSLLDLGLLGFGDFTGLFDRQLALVPLLQLLESFHKLLKHRLGWFERFEHGTGRNGVLGMALGVCFGLCHLVQFGDSTIDWKYP